MDAFGVSRIFRISVIAYEANTIVIVDVIDFKGIYFRQSRNNTMSLGQDSFYKTKC